MKKYLFKRKKITFVFFHYSQDMKAFIYCSIENDGLFLMDVYDSDGIREIITFTLPIRELVVEFDNHEIKISANNTVDVHINMSKNTVGFNAGFMQTCYFEISVENCEKIHQRIVKLFKIMHQDMIIRK